MLTITTTYPSLQVKTYPPAAEIKQKVSQIRITRDPPAMEIDQKQSSNELGLGNYKYMNEKIKEISYQKALSGIARMAQEGDEVMNRAGLFREEMIFADLAKRQMETEALELNIQAAPRTRPKITFHFEQEITWEPGGAEITFYVRPPDISWKLGGVKVDVRG